MSNTAPLLRDLGLGEPAENHRYIVHVLNNNGHVTTYTQDKPSMFVAITASESEHKKTWGYHGRTIFAEDQSFG
jgi:hypothetical protein